MNQANFEIKPGWGNRMREARVKLNMTIIMASERSGVSERAISAIEHEKTKGFSLYDVDRYRKVIGVTLDHFFGGKL